MGEGNEKPSNSLMIRRSWACEIVKRVLAPLYPVLQSRLLRFFSSYPAFAFRGFGRFRLGLSASSLGSLEMDMEFGVVANESSSPLEKLVD